MHRIQMPDKPQLVIETTEIDALRGFAHFIAYPECGEHLAPRAAKVFHQMAKNLDEGEIATQLCKIFGISKRLGAPA